MTCGISIPISWSIGLPTQPVCRCSVLVCRYLLPLKTDHPGVVLVSGDLGGPSDQTSMVHSVNNIPLVSIIEDTDRPIVWSDGQRNKYNPDLGNFAKLNCIIFPFRKDGLGL